MEKEYIDNSIAESIRNIIELCFSHTECRHFSTLKR